MVISILGCTHFSQLDCILILLNLMKLNNDEKKFVKVKKNKIKKNSKINLVNKSPKKRVKKKKIKKGNFFKKKKS